MKVIENSEQFFIIVYDGRVWFYVNIQLQLIPCQTTYWWNWSWNWHFF